jgi:16S rRNA (adenine1518-N6/adenine1519-N6)-dimethyltransferase
MISGREILRKYSLAANKNLGQNFLLEETLLAKMVDYAGDLRGRDILEVGSGPGGLTRAILEKNPRRLVAVEKDSRWVSILQRELAPFFPKLEIICGDAFHLREDLIFQGEYGVIANLPYCCGTRLLMRWLLQMPHVPIILILLLQKEVVERIGARVGTSAYGRLSVFCQYFCRVRKGFTISPGSFWPQPRVDSEVVTLLSRGRSMHTSHFKNFVRVVNGLFSCRRKTIGGQLKKITGQYREILEKCHLQLQQRGQELEPEDFAYIAQLLE